MSICDSATILQNGSPAAIATLAALAACADTLDTSSSPCYNTPVERSPLPIGEQHAHVVPGSL